jgi:hypothetical protein
MSVQTHVCMCACVHVCMCVCVCVYVLFMCAYTYCLLADMEDGKICLEKVSLQGDRRR